MLAVALLFSASLLSAPQAAARSTFAAGSGLTLTLTSIVSFGTLGLNVLVSSASTVDSSSASQTGEGSVGVAPVFNEPSGYWVLNSTLDHSVSAGGTAGDVVGNVDAALDTSAVITLQNFSDANTTFNFSWSLALDAHVTQGDLSPETDSAAAAASFSITDDLGAVPIAPGMVAANTSLPPGQGTDVRSGTISYTVLGGHTRILTAHLAASGSALALDAAEPDADGDGVPDASDNCVTVPNASQTDGDADAIGDACDSCVAISNPRVASDFLTGNAWATLTGGQRDDDHDGYGNRCDAKFPGVSGSLVGSNDLAQLRASNGRSRTGDSCGTSGTRPCAIFDLDEAATLIGSGDLAVFRLLNGKLPGPKCASCPLPCEAGASGTCGTIP